VALHPSNFAFHILVLQRAGMVGQNSKKSMSATTSSCSPCDYIELAMCWEQASTSQYLAMQGVSNLTAVSA
jgi:hypothetical protein